MSLLRQTHDLKLWVGVNPDDMWRLYREAVDAELDAMFASGRTLRASTSAQLREAPQLRRDIQS